MQTELPFFESAEDALREAVRALGGTKKVGALLWPDKDLDAASRLLMDCLNPNRAEKLDISQVIMILRLAKEAGNYAPFMWIAGEIGYDCKPVAKADEADRLATVIEQASKTLKNALEKAERVRR